MQTLAHKEIKLFFKKHKELIRSIRLAKEEAAKEIETIIRVINNMKKIESRIAIKQEDIYYLQTPPMLIRALPVLKNIVSESIKKERRNKIKLNLSLSEYSINRTLKYLQRWIRYMEERNQKRILAYNRKVREARMIYYLRRKNENTSRKP